jgi:hypothetical protein
MIDPGVLTWRKSRRSSSGNCVEVADNGESVLIRDSKDPGGPVLTFEAAAFRDFVQRLKRAG